MIRRTAVGKLRELARLSGVRESLSWWNRFGSSHGLVFLAVVGYTMADGTALGGALLVARTKIGRILPRSIESRLLFLLIVVLLPILLLQTGIYYRRFETRRAAELQSNVELSRAAGVAFQQHLPSVLSHEFAIGVAFTQPQPMPSDQANAFLAQNVQQHTPVLHFSWLNPQGRAVSSSLPEDVHLDHSDRSYFQEIAQGRE